MSYSKRTITFASSDGKNVISAYAYEPQNVQIKGVIQLSHGMIDYVGRYEEMAIYFAENGYVFAGNDHLGHGGSVSCDEDFGYFENYGHLISDLYTMNAMLHKEYPDVPIVLLGHSMGSFLSRLYVKSHPETVSGHIIHGTSGPMGAAIPMGKLLVSVIKKIRGKRYRSAFIAGLAFLGYNSKFKKSEGKYAWLSSDIERVCKRDEDKYTSFIFTAQGYYNLFSMLGECNSKSWYEGYPKSLPTLIMSGDCDPVGKYGKGVRTVYKNLLLRGCDDISLKIYPGARHELFNEVCREQAFLDILDFVSQVKK